MSVDIVKGSQRKLEDTFYFKKLAAVSLNFRHLNLLRSLVRSILSVQTSLIVHLIR